MPPTSARPTAEDAAAPSTLAPDTGLPLPKSTMMRFGAGFLLISVLWALGLSIIASVLLPQRLKDLGVESPTPSSARSTRSPPSSP